MEPPESGLRFGKRLFADRCNSCYFLDFPGLLDTAPGEGHLLGEAWTKGESLEISRLGANPASRKRSRFGPGNQALRCNADKRVAEEGHNNKESAP
jgi:hypothetical protein